MKKVEKILVPIDFSAHSINALRYALHIADKFKAKLYCLHIVKQDFGPVAYPIMPAPLIVRTTDIASERLNALVAAERGEGFKHIFSIKTEIAIGLTTALIVEKACENEADIIIMGTRQRHDVVDRLLGTATSYAIKNGKCPVLIVPEKFKKTEVKNIGYATDLTTSDPFHIWELAKVFSVFKATLSICHIKTKNQAKTALKVKDLKDFFEEKSTMLPVKFYQDRTDSVEEGLDDFLFVFDIDLLVMHPPKRTFFENLFHHSVTHEITFMSEAPVLILT